MSTVILWGPLVTNAVILVYYIVNFEPGKFLYWLGAGILNVGVLIMKG